MPGPCVPHMQVLMILQQYITLYGKGLISVINYPEIPSMRTDGGEGEERTGIQR